MCYGRDDGPHVFSPQPSNHFIQRTVKKSTTEDRRTFGLLATFSSAIKHGKLSTVFLSGNMFRMSSDQSRILKRNKRLHRTKLKASSSVMLALSTEFGRLFLYLKQFTSQRKKIHLDKTVMKPLGIVPC